MNFPCAGAAHHAELCLRTPAHSKNTKVKVVDRMHPPQKDGVPAQMQNASFHPRAHIFVANLHSSCITYFATCKCSHTKGAEAMSQ